MENSFNRLLQFHGLLFKSYVNADFSNLIEILARVNASVSQLMIAYWLPGNIKKSSFIFHIMYMYVYTNVHIFNCMRKLSQIIG